MRKYLVVRILQNILTFFLFLTLVYILIDAQPGSYADQYLNDPRLTPDQRAILRANLGLDKPVLERYFIWLGSALRGDFGISFNYPRPVLDDCQRAHDDLIILERHPIVFFRFGAGKILAWARGWGEYALPWGVGLYRSSCPDSHYDGLVLGI
jgi:peptide/nickel transport system permease protein